MIVALLLPLFTAAQATVCDVTAPPWNASGDGTIDDTVAVQAALDAPSCAIVLLPATTGIDVDAVFLTNALWLRRNDTELRIARGATLRAQPASRWTRATRYTRHGGWTNATTRLSLLNAGDCLDLGPAPDAPGDQCRRWRTTAGLRIAGGGTIDGTGHTWWDVGNASLDATRPTLLELAWVDGLAIEGVTLTNPPFWTMHPIFCNDVYVSNVTVQTVGTPNGDGIDIDSSTNVLVEDSTFDTGDDCVAVKSGMDADGRAWAKPTVNVTVRRVNFQRGHGVSIGSDCSAGVQNVTFEDITCNGTAAGVRLKTQRGRGGVARHDSAEDFFRLNALLFTAMGWIFIPAYCFAVP